MLTYLVRRIFNIQKSPATDRDGNMDRTGKVTVMKKNDGSFKVNGLTYQ